MVGEWMACGGQELREQGVCLNIFLFPVASSVFTDFACHLYHNSPRFNLSLISFFKFIIFLNIYLFI